MNEEMNNLPEKPKTTNKPSDVAGKAVNTARKAKKAKALLASGPVIFWGTVIIVAIIVIIGIIMFLVTMPGMVMDKLKAIFGEVSDYIAVFFGADMDKQKVKDSDIFQALDYLEDMGYDLKGYGLLTDYYTSEDKSTVEQGLTAEQKEDYEIDGDIGVARQKSDGKILLAKSDFIFTYMVSDNYIYTMKNTNLVASTGNNDFWGWIQSIFNSIAIAMYRINNFFFSGLNDLLGITDGVVETWGRGMLRIYYEGSGLGREGSLYSGGLFNHDTVAIDTTTKELVLAKNDLFSNNEPIRYSLDGWVGRYGMPLEFLLSVHMATMMPDLAYDMATSFDTNVDIYLKAVEVRIGDSVKSTYTPYIAKVLRHWYRDVYYVINTNDTDVDFVIHDYDYEQIYKERWTLYEVYSDDDSVNTSEYKDYADDNYGNYKLYLINDKGEYKTDSDITEDERNNLKVFKDLKHTNYYIYTGTKEEAKNDGIYVTKKAISLERSEENLTNLGWNQLSGDLWSAYMLNERKVAYNKKAVSDASGAIRQTGEGLRTETNPTIKKMFLQNYYFRYDGTHKTAEIITALRKKLKEDKLSNGDKYGALNELVVSGGNTIDLISENISYTPAQLGLDTHTFKDESYKVNDYSGQVVLNQDSLNAFTMLENTHTLDADYIYRDFKELVVELGYFTREELTDEVPRVLHWPVPEIASTNYPYRALEKRENEYGTMMHSKGDVLAKQYMELDLKGLKENRTDLLRPKLEDTTRKEICGKWWNYKYSTILTKDVTPEDCVEKADEIWHYLAEHEFKNSSSNLAESFEEAKKGVGVYNADTNYSHTEYNVSTSTFVAWVLIELDTKFENYCNPISHEERYSPTPRGKDEEPVYKTICSLHDVVQVSIDKLNGEIINEYSNLRAGDLIAFINKNSKEVNDLGILGKKEDGKFVKYSGGQDFHKDDKLEADFDENEFYDATKYEACFGIRIFGEPEFTGYKGNEMVVSPVTGILLEYGTYDGTQENSITKEKYRVNTDLKYGQIMPDADEEQNTEIDEKQIVSENVGYAKILVLTKDDYLELEKNTDSQFKNDSLVDERGNFRETLVDDEDGEITALDKVRTLEKSKEDERWSFLDQTIYTYKEYAETYEQAGISGYIVYVDGFVCEEPDELIEDTSTQIPYKKNGTLDQQRKNEASITLGDNPKGGLSYKQVTPDKIENRDDQLPSKCIENQKFTTSNTEINHKFEAEERAKLRAANSIYLDEVKYIDEDGKEKTKSLTFIKEGTILGRTITDKELLEDPAFRNGKFGTYEENRQFSEWRKIDGEDKVIGNYLRFIMRDLDGTPVEDVEDYMKDSAFSKEDWYELYFYTPFPSGGTDIYMCGAEAIGSCTPGEIGVGLVQETDTIYPYHNTTVSGSAITKFLYKCWLMDPVLCSPLETFFKYDGKMYWELAEGGRSFGSGWPAYGRVYHDPRNPSTGQPMCIYLGTSGGVRYKVVNGAPVIYIPEEDDGKGYYIIYKLPSGDYVDEWGFKLLMGKGGFQMDDGYPQREIDFDVYVYGEDKELVSTNLHSSILQEILSYICDVDREKFTQIQREVAKEIYLEADILTQFPWMADRPEALQCCIITILVSGSESYKNWLGDHKDDPAPYEDILEQVSIDKSKVGSTLGPASGDPTTGHAWTVPEIARRIMDGSLTKYDVEDWVRYDSVDLLQSCGVDYRTGGTPGYLSMLQK